MYTHTGNHGQEKPKHISHLYDNYQAQTSGSACEHLSGENNWQNLKDCPRALHNKRTAVRTTKHSRVTRNRETQCHNNRKAILKHL